ncbi:MAG: TRAP transporter small permease [Alphaproteobacteria bacterium]|nr:TRAP transporter small permease [Alphaproteobacteria bacterium]
MFMPMPSELQWLLAILVPVALALAWTIRDGWRDPAGRLDPWRAIEDTMSQFLMLAMLAASSLQVVVRYAFSETLNVPWTEEFARLVMLWLALWGAATLQRSDDHITMTVVYDLAPAWLRRAMLLAGDAVTLGVLAPVTWFGWQNAGMLDIMSTISLGLPLSIFAYTVPVSGGLMILHTIALIAKRLLGKPVRPASEPAI